MPSKVQLVSVTMRTSSSVRRRPVEQQLLDLIDQDRAVN